jgi:hypothetical protein
MGMSQVDSVLSPTNRSKVLKPLDLETSIHVNQLASEEAALIQNTQQAALPAIANTEIPHSSDVLAADRVTLGAPQSTDEEPLLDPEKLEISKTAITDFPALALAAVEAGLKHERYSNDVLNKHIEEAQGHQKTIDLMLDFSAELTALGDGGAMTPKMNELVRELKTLGVDLKLEEGTKIAKDRAIELKSLNSSFIDQRRSKLQILFSTKIQVEIQNISSIMEVLKNIIKDNTRLNSTIVGHSGGR